LQIDWDSKNNGIENPDQKHPISVGNKNDNEGRDNSIVRSTHDFIQLIKTEGCYSLEIGPLDKSLLDCSLATVKTLDYLSKEQLVEKYKNEENVCTSNIVNVDYVWKGEAYDELIKIKFDNVLASHVIEHTPDLIGFLKNASSILKPKGFLFLIIPDKRFCFDHFREDTLLFEVAYAHQQKLKKPTLHSIIDMHRATAHNDPVKHWKGEHDNKLIADFLTDFTKPYKQYIEHIEELEKIYIDSHVWKFTSESFEKISNYLFREKVVDLETIKIYPTSSDTHQFYVVMQKMP
jgi:2-polyprenyl-3-methyl-5-hydroxy-6-metoxy-1,4-benzoquinol methylase